MPPGPDTRRAYAKVNLALAVGPPLPAGSPNAGYHPIASWMHSIDLFDEVSARRLEDGAGSRVRVEWARDAPRPSPIDWPIEKDLAFRAHAALERAAGRTLPVELTVRKRIPVGGGLGGGSSDAAAALVLLDQLFGLGLGPGRLAETGHALGSDVPFFIDPPHCPARPAVVSGLGEAIARTEPLGAEVILLIPGFGCETRAVYRAYDASPAPAPREPDVWSMARSGITAGLFNDLTGAAERVEPRLAEVRRRAARAAGVPVHMSGSGSSLFVVKPGGAAEAMERKMRAELPDVVVVRTRLVSPGA